jgi:hypothetical protein
MKRFVGAAVASLGLLAGLCGGTAWGQSMYGRGPAYPGQRPTYSPYLNLFRGGNPVLNYYGLVKPEFEFRGAVAGLRTQVAGAQSDINALQAGDTTLPATGRKVGFMTQSKYFMTMSGALNPAGGRSVAVRGQPQVGAGAPAAPQSGVRYGIGIR